MYKGKGTEHQVSTYTIMFRGCCADFNVRRVTSSSQVMYTYRHIHAFVVVFRM